MQITIEKNRLMVDFTLAMYSEIDRNYTDLCYWRWHPEHSD